MSVDFRATSLVTMQESLAKIEVHGKDYPSFQLL